MRIRHVLEPNGLHAMYFMDAAPWGTIIKCMYPALVSRESLDDPTEMVDEIVGMVVFQSGIGVADEPPEGLHFKSYIDRNATSDSDWNNLVANVGAWGKQAYDRQHPQVVELPEELLEERTRTRRGR